MTKEPMGGWYWFSCNQFTIAVKVSDDAIIEKTAPIARKFVGKPAYDLARWMRSLGGFRSERLLNVRP